MVKEAWEMTLDEVEHEIAQRYRGWAKRHPGLNYPETGRLAELWRRADYLYEHGSD